VLILRKVVAADDDRTGWVLFVLDVDKMQV